MRDFLKELNIVGIVHTWCEGGAVRFAIDNLLRWCDHICVVQDYPDLKTDNIIREYKKAYPDIIQFEYLKTDIIRTAKNCRRREKIYREKVVEQKLAMVREIHKDHPVDILLTPDSDEMFTDFLPEILKEFWEGDFTSICTKSMDVQNTFYLIHNRGMMSHWRAYKYDPIINFTPRRYQDHYNIYPARDAWRGLNGGFVHLCQLNEFQELKKDMGHKMTLDVHPETKFWIIDKPAYELMPDEYVNIIKNIKPSFTAKDNYEEVKNFSYKG